MTTRILSLSLLLLGACASKTDQAPPADPEPATDPAPPAEPVAAAEPEASEAPAKAEEPAAAGDLLAVLQAQANAKTFAELVVGTNLEKELRSTEGSGWTLLVPTDDAFAKLPKAQLDKLKKSPEEREKFLKFHIVPGKYTTGKLTNFRTAPTALGPELDVKTVQDTEVTIQGASFVETDIEAANGYLQKIDRVLQQKKK